MSVEFTEENSGGMQSFANPTVLYQDQTLKGPEGFLIRYHIAKNKTTASIILLAFSIIVCGLALIIFLYIQHPFGSGNNSIKRYQNIDQTPYTQIISQ